jgi:transcriptional regulator with XRE-family HTH domain
VLRLKQFHEGKGYSQRQLAASAKVRQATISSIERGRLEFELLEKLANALGVSAAVLVDYTQGKRGK